MNPAQNQFVKIDHVARDLQTTRKEQNVKWKAALMILVALAIVVTRQSRLGTYLLMEAVTFLLVIAAVLGLLLFFLNTFFVLWHGVCASLFWLEEIARHISAVNRHRLSSENEMRHPVLR